MGMFFVDYASFSESRNSIILMTVRKENKERFCSLFEFSLRTNQFRHCKDWDLSHRLLKRASVMTLDERYIVTFGKYHDQLMILDLSTYTITECVIKCPIATGYRAVLLGSNEQD